MQEDGQQQLELLIVMSTRGDKSHKQKKEERTASIELGDAVVDGFRKSQLQRVACKASSESGDGQGWDGELVVEGQREGGRKEAGKERVMESEAG